MALKDVVKVNRKTFFDPRRWMGYDSLKLQTNQIFQIFKAIFTTPAPERTETYQEALIRLDITDAESQETGQNYFIYSLVFFIIASATFAFGFILLFYYGTFAGWLIALSTAALFFAQAFRFNFWYFQIKHRKLGCTFEEWKNGQPSEDKSAEDKPVEDKPAEDKPAEDKSAEDKPAEDKPSEDKPAEDKPAEDKPAEDKSAEDKSAEDKPSEDKPAEDKPSEDKPSEDKPADDKPAEDKPSEDKPAEDKPTDDKPSDNERSS